MSRQMPGWITATIAFIILTVALLFLSHVPLAATSITPPAMAAGQGVALPDLIIEKITVTPPNPGPGSVSDITITVKNIGTAAVTDFDLYLYVEPVDNPPTLATPLTTRTIYGDEPLAPGATWSFTRSGQPFTQENPQIYAWVDRNNQIVEANENNNLFPPVSTLHPDEFDLDPTSDDNCSDAKPILVNAPPQQHNLAREGNQPDADWVKFEAKADVVYVASAISIGADANLLINSRNRCDGPPGLGVRQTITIPALSNSTYYLKIEHQSSAYGPDNAYELVVESDERCGRFEPNNRCEVATDLFAGDKTIESTFCIDKDIDWYRFEVEPGVTYTMTARNVGSKANLAMKLYDNCNGRPLDSGLQMYYTAVEQGYLYLQSTNQSAQTSGIDTTYAVKVAADLAGRCREDSYEQGAGRDDTITQAQPILANHNAQIHNSCPAGDVDWVKFNANAGITYTVETFDLAAKADTKLCLHDTTGKEIQCDDDAGAGAGSRLVLTNTIAGEYYFSVRALNPRAAGANTQYSFQVITGACQNDAFEPDNGRTAARPLPTDNTLQPHTICGQGDEDWHAFDALANTPYIIESVHRGPEADTVLELYNQAGALLASNDDYTDSVGSQLNYTVTIPGKYYTRVRLYNPTHYGTGTNYAVRVRTGIIASPPLPPAPSPGDSVNRPPEGGIRTLILLNHSYLTQRYGAEATQQLMTKLDQLIRHEKVQGELVRLDEITEIQAAYDQWQQDFTSVGLANQTADAIRRTILSYRSQHAGLRYLLLIGDDRVLPFYRLPDRTIETPEKTYAEVNEKHPTGAALRGNYYLTDDFYATDKPTITSAGTVLYIPDLAVGRLIETPADMGQLIDRFLGAPMPVIDRVLVTGWTFVSDVAAENCRNWRQMLRDNTQTKVNCAMIGEFWTQQQFRDARLQTNPRYVVQSINGHAAHFGDQSPDLVTFNVSLVEAANIDYAGGLVYAVGCHSGLNVPPENSGESSVGTHPLSALDLPESFIRKGANYVGNTGFGYGIEGGIVLSELMVQYYTEELGKRSFGQALMAAKQRYYRQLTVEPTAHDQKVMQQLVYYGLPMFHEIPESLGDPVDPFPGVGFDLSLPSLGDQFNTRTATLNFQNGNITKVEATDGQGEYFTLSGQAQGIPGQPLLPLYYKELGQANTTMRSVVIRNASYTITTGIDPLVVTPINEYSQNTTELALDATSGWYPAVPIRVQTLSDGATLATQVAQYNPATGQLRQFRTLQVELLSSNSADKTPPIVLVVDGLYNQQTGQISVKVGASDSSGIDSVTLVYAQDGQTQTGAFQSLKLQFDSAAHKWRGVFPGTMHTRFYAQVVDGSGNKTDANDKGRWYAPAIAFTGKPSNAYGLFLPLVNR